MEDFHMQRVIKTVQCVNNALLQNSEQERLFICRIYCKQALIFPYRILKCKAEAHIKYRIY